MRLLEFERERRLHAVPGIRIALLVLALAPAVSVGAAITCARAKTADGDRGTVNVSVSSRAATPIQSIKPRPGMAFISSAAAFRAKTVGRDGVTSLLGAPSTQSTAASLLFP
jgi:hypothetical protein